MFFTVALYVIPFCLGLLQVYTLLFSPKSEYRDTLKYVYRLLSYKLQDWGIYSFDGFLLVFVPAVVLLPGVNLWAYVIASGRDMSYTYAQVRSWARSVRFQDAGGESYDLVTRERVLSERESRETGLPSHAFSGDYVKQVKPTRKFQRA